MGRIAALSRIAFLFLSSGIILHLLYSFHWYTHSNVYIRFYRKVNSFNSNHGAAEEVPGPPVQVPPSSYIEPYTAVNDSIARDLYTKIRVLCWVMTGPKYHWSKARHVKQTWGRRCNMIVFISSEEDERIPTVKVPSIESYDTLWGKTREAFRYVWERYHDKVDWFLKADDDSYIIMENLRYFLSPFNTSEPLHFGHKFRAYVESGYMQGGSGYILSKEALRRFVEIGLNDSEKCSQVEGPEDVEIGKCLENLGCKAMDTRDVYGRDRFLPLPLEDHLTIGILEFPSYFYDGHPSFYPIKMKFDCCSDSVIGFHKVYPALMYTYEFLIYHVQPFGIDFFRSRIQSTPAAPPDLQLKAKPMFDKIETSDDNHLKTMKLLRRKNRLMESRFNQAEMIELYGNDFAGEQNQKTESNSITHS